RADILDIDPAASHRLGIGIVGLRMGYGHFRQCKNLDNADLVGVCDLNEDLVEQVRGEFDVPVASTDYEDLLASDDIDIISVTTPDYLHREQTIAAFEAGKHVIVEKPMARTVEECEKMVQAAREYDKKLMVAQVVRFSQFPRDVRQWVDEGTLGDIYYLETSYIHNYEKIGGFNGWRFDPEKRHILIGGGCHAIDLIRWFGGDALEVSAYSNHFNIPQQEVDDMWVLNIQFPNEVIGHVTVSSGCQRPYGLDLKVWGTEGTVEGQRTDTTARMALRDVGYNRWMEFDKETAGKAIAGELQHFVNCVVNDETPLIDGVDGAKTVATAWAAIESSKNNGAPVKVRNDF
ncbi:MAG: Gfo/Idh/MocA family oxidoreductase, partial [Armatimonadota bacterium]